ncbi:uncharacterized protein LOC117180639 [Belonocnema kinseyi]|uniref:uncharacterized protein LOC117180639 n=1 Tax=Belonocnema kinseyi TaxID=2817044 RepID=UPI00143DA0F4|nr:uncharacterized protein LOC117180639 [Belonocnema kinseyi]
MSQHSTLHARPTPPWKSHVTSATNHSHHLTPPWRGGGHSNKGGRGGAGNSQPHEKKDEIVNQQASAFNECIEQETTAPATSQQEAVPTTTGLQQVGTLDTVVQQAAVPPVTTVPTTGLQQAGAQEVSALPPAVENLMRENIALQERLARREAELTLRENRLAQEERLVQPQILGLFPGSYPMSTMMPPYHPMVQFGMPAQIQPPYIQLPFYPCQQIQHFQAPTMWPGPSTSGQEAPAQKITTRECKECEETKKPKKWRGSWKWRGQGSWRGRASSMQSVGKVFVYGMKYSPVDNTERKDAQNL